MTLKKAYLFLDLQMMSLKFENVSFIDAFYLHLGQIQHSQD